MDTLVDSSEKTLIWLSKLRRIVEENNFPLTYNEVKYWASFKHRERNRNIVFLHSQKNQIRLFTKLDCSDNELLKPTPSTKKWARNYPSIFIIRNEDMIVSASKLIMASYSIYLHS